MAHSPQKSVDGSRVAQEADRDLRKINRRVDALTGRVKVIEDYIADDLFIYLGQLAVAIPFNPPPRPPWA